MVSGQRLAPAAPYLWERPGSNFTGGWAVAGVMNTDKLTSVLSKNM
jgi:hypothetical protein